MDYSVIVCAYNGWPYTRLFLESLSAATACRHELILVDNGSTDETPAGLSAFAEARDSVIVLRHPTNLGVAKGWNSGLRVARGRYLVICNNDVVLSLGWLERLADELKAGEHLGAVCASTNQVVFGYYPDDFADERTMLAGRPWPGPDWGELRAYYGDFAGFAGHFGHKYANRRFPSFHAPCMMFRREILDDIGGFDEGFGQAFYEDVDFFARILLNHRYNLTEIYGGVYVHHFAGATAIPQGVPRMMDESGPVFVRKWRAITGDRDWLGPYSAGLLDRDGLLRLREEVRDRLPPRIPV